MALSSENPTYLWKIEPDTDSLSATFYYKFGEIALAQIDYDPILGCKAYIHSVENFDEPLFVEQSLEAAMTAIEKVAHIRTD
jgi:hypothetical protein